MNVMAQLADELAHQPRQQSGYVAERHPTMPTLIVVWAPCKCYWVGDTQDGFVSSSNSFLSSCQTPECTFSWREAQLALAALSDAEKNLKENKDGVLPAGSSSGVPNTGLQAGRGPEETLVPIQATLEPAFGDDGDPNPVQYDLGGEG